MPFINGAWIELMPHKGDTAMRPNPLVLNSVPFLPRRVCDLCHRTIPTDQENTVFWDESDPVACEMDLCPSCAVKEERRRRALALPKTQTRLEVF